MFTLDDLKQKLILWAPILVGALLLLGIATLAISFLGGGGTAGPVRSVKEEIIKEARTRDLAFLDDGRLVYTVLLTGGTRELWSYDPISKQSQLILEAGKVQIEKTRWSKDGKAVILDLEGSVWLFSAGQLAKLSFRGYGFSWNPAGTEIAFANDRFFGVNDPEGLNLYNLTTGRVTNIVKDVSVTAKETQWSPDGAKILDYVFSDEGIGNVEMLNPDGSQRTVVIAEGFGRVGNIIWSSDSRSLLYSLGGRIYRRNLSGGDVVEVINLQASLPLIGGEYQSLIYVAKKELGQVLVIKDRLSQAIYETKEKGPIVEMLSKESQVAISSTKQLVLISLDIK